ncbi:ABC transporter ATP-binding protein [Dictyobacter arantiisoli]|uniref:ABC transporter ATP-binding protein n=1 Tax=Dictyobacter arantiisoli TaxID=2014874 RepID=A0A5A5T7T8_9CHLR|nr:ABC transporter ATP-binding protein [Dictyobacter arantiisoli]GCF07004.1 ABC transporter ATP-binding protein [Dictyobacter arantiisoli]
MQTQLVICDNLIKIYKAGELETVALQGLDLDVYQGEMISIVGASGSGKSTLLNILGGLDVPSAGRITVAGHDLSRLNEEDRASYRRQIIGYVWQQSGRNLLPDMTIEENLILPQMLNGISAGRSKRRAHELLELIGLATHARRKPVHLSGGQQQRVAIAVALANQPALLLADEPTGELDSTTTQEIIAFFRSINQKLGVTIIIVTHDIAVATQVDRTIAIRDGRTSTETIRREQPINQQQPFIPDALSAFQPAQSSAVIGLPEATHQETIFIDRVGLLQLPADALERVALRGRAEVHLAPDHIELWPAGMGEQIYQGLPGNLANHSSAVIGLPAHSHRETIMVDRVGRLQLPQNALEHLPFSGRAFVRTARSHIQLWPVPMAANDFYPTPVIQQ